MFSSLRRGAHDGTEKKRSLTCFSRLLVASFATSRGCRTVRMLKAVAVMRQEIEKQQVRVPLVTSGSLSLPTCASGGVEPESTPWSHQFPCQKGKSQTPGRCHQRELANLWEPTGPWKEPLQAGRLRRPVWRRWRLCHGLQPRPLEDFARPEPVFKRLLYCMNCLIARAVQAWATMNLST